MNLVDAQQARRVLDRIVGYKISPILWSKIKRGLSAGRVQSVALRIICDREKEIDEYISQEYWSLIANILVPGAKKTLEAHFAGDKNGKIGGIVSKEWREKKEAATAIYNKYFTAGSIEASEYVYTKDNASCTGTL